MSGISANRIKIISINRIREDGAAAYEVVLGLMDYDLEEPLLKYRTTVPVADIYEEHLIKLARSWFHNVCKAAAAATEEWNLTEDEAKSYFKEEKK